MTRKNKLEEGTEEIVQPVRTILFNFEDLTISSNPDTTITINKTLSGISDSCYARSAIGSQKNWSLYTENDVLIETGNQHGNRSFTWSGNLEPGLYTLTTGVPSKNFTKHRIPGRNYQVTFRV